MVEPKINIHCDIFQALLALVAINERGIDPLTVLQEAQFVVQEVMAGRMGFDTVTPGDEPRMPAPESWHEVRRGSGEIDLSSLADGEFVTATGLHDGGYIVWKK